MAHTPRPRACAHRLPHVSVVMQMHAEPSAASSAHKTLRKYYQLLVLCTLPPCMQPASATRPPRPELRLMLAAPPQPTGEHAAPTAALATCSHLAPSLQFAIVEHGQLLPACAAPLQPVSCSSCAARLMAVTNAGALRDMLLTKGAAADPPRALLHSVRWQPLHSCACCSIFLWCRHD